MSRKWRNLWLLAIAELLAMSLWFSASAVVPQLAKSWTLSAAEKAWLTMSVQLGFVAGAIGSALLNLPDRMSLRALISVSAFLGAVLNGTIALGVDTPGPAILLRFLTGATLAGVYPPGMKLMATWCKEDRGFGIGFLIGALCIGSALPHLLNSVPFLMDLTSTASWRQVVLGASIAAMAGALIAATFVQPGPHYLGPAPAEWRHAAEPLQDRAVMLANFGYLGHMWELYAMWTWVPIFLLQVYDKAGWSEVAARRAAFAVIAIGAVGCVAAGRWADRSGRTLIATLALSTSGSCALLVGWLGPWPGLATVVCLVWGISVVADSAQFSAAVSELSDPRYVGTALTVQTSLGFLLTMVTIRMVPPLVDLAGWGLAFGVLALGPVFGVISMLKLRALPESTKMASGKR